MRAFTKSLFVVLAGALLASCGGGGGSDSTGGFTPQGLKVSVQPASSTSTPNSLLGITVRVNNTNDTPVGDFIGYHNRTGKHDVTDFDWSQYLSFAKRHWGL